MRPLEIVLLVLLAAASLRLLVPSWHASRTFGRVLAVVLGAIVVSHAVIEGVRWQLVPAYAVALLFVLAGLGRRAPRAGPLARTCGILGLAVTLVAAGLAWALPVPQLGPLPGEHDVATTTFRLVDASRDERYTDDPDDAREVVVQAWFPTRDRGPRAPFVERPWAFGAATADFLELPAVALSHLGLIETRSVQDGAISDAETAYPVLVYSHGWGGFRRVQLDLMENLASHGYAVFAIDHTYGSSATVFPDGPVVALEPSALPEDAPTDEYQAAAATLERVFAGDVRLLLDHLESDANATRFGGLLDLTRVGLLGHSTGGGAVVTACAFDERCDAVAGLDPWVEPVPDDVLTQGVDVPLLTILSSEWVGDQNEALLGRLHAASSQDRGRLAIAETNHRDFTLLPMLSPIAGELGLSGATGGARTHAIVEDYLVSFFDAALREGGGAVVAADPPPFEEVTRRSS